MLCPRCWKARTSCTTFIVSEWPEMASLVMGMSIVVSTAAASGCPACSVGGGTNGLGPPASASRKYTCHERCTASGFARQDWYISSM